MSAAATRATLLAAALTGCQAGSTSVALDIATADDSALTSDLQVRVFGPYRQQLPDATHVGTYRAVKLPGTIVLVPSDSSPLRILISQLSPGSLTATARVTPRDGERVRALLVLRNEYDVDSDGVPDEIDDCLSAANDTQADHDGDHIGDACPSDPPCPYLFCEDFEAELSIPNKWDGPNAQAGGRVTRDTGQHHSGDTSLLIHGEVSANNQTSAYIEERGFLPEPDLFIRAYYFVPAAAQSLALDLAGAYFSPPDELLTFGLAADGNVRLRVADPRSTISSFSPFPFGQWTCLQWQVSRALGGEVTTNAWIDGRKVSFAPAAPITFTSSRYRMRVGTTIDNSGTDQFPPQSVDFWIDDVAIDSKLPPCSP